MQHYISALQNYISNQIIQVAWQELQKSNAAETYGGEEMKAGKIFIALVIVWVFALAAVFGLLGFCLIWRWFAQAGPAGVRGENLPENA